MITMAKENQKMKILLKDDKNFYIKKVSDDFVLSTEKKTAEDFSRYPIDKFMALKAQMESVLNTGLEIELIHES